MPLSYNSAIPAAGNSPADDQPLMQQNFNSIPQLLEVDHESFGSVKYGQHKKVTLPEQASDPAKINSTGIVYTKNSSANTELFYEGQTTGGKVLQITNQSLPSNAGAAMFPGGVEIRCGTGSTNATINFNPAFPAGFTVYVLVTNNNVGGTTTSRVNQASVTTTGFAVAGSTTFAYIAIGFRP